MSHRIPAFLMWLLLCAAAGVNAQGALAASIAGRSVDEQGGALAAGEVVVTHEATGSAMRTNSRADGRYSIDGLEVGGPYALTARRVGFPSTARAGLYLNLGQRLQVDIVMTQRPVTLATVETRAIGDRGFSRAHTGIQTLLSDSLIHSIPVINRDIYDLVRLVPQMSTGFALTPSGAGTRTTSIRID